MENTVGKCIDLKVIRMLLEQQGNYTKMPCFVCEWVIDHLDKRPSLEVMN